jgi:glycosyltransferase involved in cell wall biosynthesis
MTRAFVPNGAGVQRSSYNIGKYLKNNGYQVGYYSTKKEGHQRNKFNGFTLISPHHAGGLNNRMNQVQLASFLQSWEPDIVINQMPYERVLRDFLFEEKRTNDYKIISCIHNSLFTVKNNLKFTVQQFLPTYFKQFSQYQLILKIALFVHYWKHRKELRKILLKTDNLVLLSPQNIYELQYFIKSYDHGKVTYIPNSIPEVDSELNKIKKKKLLYVGSLNNHQKRVDLLLKVWEKTFERLDDWTFDIVGDGREYRKLEDEINQTGLSNVTLWGHQDPTSFYREASILIMTSAYEGFPNVLLEAQSKGVVPVLMNSYSALEWIVNESEDALLVTPYDFDKMAEKIIYLAENSDVRKRMAFNALENASRFTGEEVGKMWTDLLKKVL